MTNAAAAKLETTEHETRKGFVALKAFFGIVDAWGCTQQQQMALLGGIGRTTLHQYRRLPQTRLSRDVMERISLVMGIYKALQILYPTAELANERIRRNTPDAPFGGLSALEFMTQGSILYLWETRRYFDAQRGW